MPKRYTGRNDGLDGMNHSSAIHPNVVRSVLRHCMVHRHVHDHAFVDANSHELFEVFFSGAVHNLISSRYVETV